MDCMTEAKEKPKLGSVLSDKSKWIQGYLAKNEKGTYVSYLDPQACKFCLTGAIHLLASKPCEGSNIPGCRIVDEALVLSMAHKLADIIAKKTGKKKLKCFDLIVDFNDDDKTTFKQVQEVIKEFDK